MARNSTRQAVTETSEKIRTLYQLSTTKYIPRHSHSFPPLCSEKHVVEERRQEVTGHLPEGVHESRLREREVGVPHHVSVGGNYFISLYAFNNKNYN